MKRKNIVILGSTGSIGRSALDVVARYPERFAVVGLTANSNIALLRDQIEACRPEVVAVADPERAAELASQTDVPVLSGQQGLISVASDDRADFVLSAIVGAAGLVPTMAAIRKGRTIGLANKETLVVAGDLVMSEARQSGAQILPVDSEHSAVFQCLEGLDDMQEVSRIILTASGGPFAGLSREELECKKSEDALKHPSWSMGRKITIDSATLMNKGLEVIEARWLFGLEPERIDVMIHPQSIVHSMVEFRDGGVLAQLSVPDMKGAIAYALSYPERLDAVMPRMDLAAIGELTFRNPDTTSFPCLALAYEAINQGGTMPAVLNAANEVSVEAFLSGAIGFNDIPAIIKNTMQAHDSVPASALDIVLSAHEWAVAKAQGLVSALPAK